jgi:hypothetical protein
VLVNGKTEMPGCIKFFVLKMKAAVIDIVGFVVGCPKETKISSRLGSGFNMHLTNIRQWKSL